MAGMKRATIARVCKKQLDLLADAYGSGHKTLIAENLSAWLYLADNIIITGGSIASMLLGESVNDFDVYFRSEEAAKKVCDYFAANLPHRRPKRGELTILCTTPNAMMLSNGIQLVTRFTGEPEEVLANFDFVHCTNYWTHKDGLVLSQIALESLLAKNLVYCGSKFPICSILRTRKFIRRGWKIGAGQYLKMCMQISKLALNEALVLKDQLTGVDVLYFARLLAIIEEHGSVPNPQELDDLIETIENNIESRDNKSGVEV